VAQGAYCNGCGTRVQLTEQGECPRGHLRSMLRDVREGEVVATAAPGAASGAPKPAAPLGQPASHELLSAVIGKAFVIVPLAAIVAFGLWTGYDFGVGSGMSVGLAILMSIASLAGTVGLAFVWARITSKKR